jgi:putative peptidoglycan lipid II flippase
MSATISNAAYRNGLKHSLVIAVSMALIIIFGFIPHVLIAKKIGLGGVTDAYLMAISINQIIVKLLRIGTLPKIFMMVLSDDFITNKKATEASINIFINIFILLSFFAMSLIYFGSPILVNIIAKGFDADKKLLTINILQILVPSFLYQYLISLFEGVFKLRNEFSRWAILSIIPQFIITIFVYFYVYKIGIYSIVYGALAGFFIHLCLLIYFIYFKFKYSYHFMLTFKHHLFHKMIRLIFPYYLSSIPVQLMMGIQSFLVSMLPTGTASVFFYVKRIIDYVEQFSINIFSQLMLPYFLKKIAQLSIEHIKNIYSQLMCITNYTHLPFLIMLIVLGRQIIEIVFSGKFTSGDTISTLGVAFSCFMIFNLPEPSNDVQSNIILAMKKTMWFNLVNISRMIIVITLSIVLFEYYKFWGIIFSYSITNLQGFLINQWYLKKKYSFENILFNQRFMKIIALNILFAFFCFYLNYYIQHNFLAEHLYQKIIAMGVVISFGIIFYGLISYLFKIEEMKILLALVKKDSSGKYNLKGL